MAKWQTVFVCNSEATYVTPRFCVCMTHGNCTGSSVRAIDWLLMDWMLSLLLPAPLIDSTFSLCG